MQITELHIENCSILEQLSGFSLTLKVTHFDLQRFLFDGQLSTWPSYFDWS